MSLQRRARCAAADIGEPVDRHRHAQALPQGPGADAGDPAAGRRGRPGRHALRERGPAAARPVDQPAAAVYDRIPACLGMASACRHQHKAAAARAPTARFQRTTRATWFAARATIRARTYPASGRRPRRNAAATSRTCRWAPTPGTAIRTRSCPAPRRGRDATRGSTPGRGVIPAPTVNNGLNPLPADQLPPPQSSAPTSDPLSPPARAASAAVDNNPTRASTLRHQGHRLHGGVQPVQR